MFRGHLCPNSHLIFQGIISPRFNKRSETSLHNCCSGTYKVQVCVRVPSLRKAVLWEVTTDLHSSWHFLCVSFSAGKLLRAQWKLPAESSHVAPKALSPPAGGLQRPAHLLHCTDEGNPTAPADSTRLRWAYENPCKTIWECRYKIWVMYVLHTQVKVPI